MFFEEISTHGRNMKNKKQNEVITLKRVVIIIIRIIPEV